MEIFYIKKSSFLTEKNQELLMKFKQNELISPQRAEERAMWRLLLDCVLKNFYKISAYEIEYKNKKPILKNSNLHFSVSHSKDIVALAIDEFNIGADIEFIRPINLQKFSKRYDKTFSTLEDFYKFWTEYEASIKLQEAENSRLTFKFLNDYIFSLASKKEITSLNIYELKENLCLKKSEFSL